MPKLSDTMEEGKILRWLKHPGEAIHHGEAIAEVETDKADMVMEAFDDGVLDEIRVKEGESAKVGAVIAVLRSAGGVSRAPTERPPTAAPELRAAPEQEAQANGGGVKPTEIKAPAEELETSAAETQRGRVAPVRQIRRRRAFNADAEIEKAGAASFSQAPEAEEATTGSDEGSQEQPPSFHPAMSALQSAAPTAIAAAPHRPISVAEPEHRAAPAPSDGKLRASPLARRAAEEAGIDLGQVQGTGPEGRITKRDIDNFLREQQLFKFRRLIAPREGAAGHARRAVQDAQDHRPPNGSVQARNPAFLCHRRSRHGGGGQAQETHSKQLNFSKRTSVTTTSSSRPRRSALGRYTRMNASFER